MGSFVDVGWVMWNFRRCSERAFSSNFGWEGAGRGRGGRMENGRVEEGVGKCDREGRRFFYGV